MEELRNQVSTFQTERERLLQEVRALEGAKISAETTLSASQEFLSQKQEFVEETGAALSNTFRALAADALAGNTQGFITLAEEKFKALREESSQELEHRKSAIEALLQPLAEALRVYQQETQALEGKRLQDLSAIGEQLRQLASVQTALQAETTKLGNALRSPQTRGRWGEMALRKTAE